MLKVEGLFKAFGGVELFNGLSFEVKEGDFVAIVGPSGSGKTTLLMIVVGLLKPDKGKVKLLGKDITSIKGGELERLRREEVGLVFQEPQLFNHLSAEENVRACATLTKRLKDEEIEELFKELGIDYLKGRKVKNLSGGEKQRVSLARALSKRPKILIADEPTASLDYKNTQRILELMLKLRRRYNLTVLVATHDPVVMERADLIVNLRKG